MLLNRLKYLQMAMLPVHEHDTIAAISTPQGAGGIGIVRMSGDKAFAIAAKILKTKKDFSEIDTHTVSYAKVIDPSNEDVLDEVLVVKMQGPRTFTKEDVVEINCHGGSVVIQKVLALVVYEGARLADPGEFTKRAFLNGRMDLSQAEAVIDVINAKTERGVKIAINQLEGNLSLEIKALRAKIIGLLAHCEVTIDYPEYDIDQITEKQVAQGLQEILKTLEAISFSFDKGRIIRDGANVVIAGRPNVGKSSLLNALIGHQKAIVTDIPGTTRDIIEEYINIRGIPVKMTDTAGLRETEDFVEKIGVDRAKKAVEAADLVIFMLDALEKAPSLPPGSAIVVINKIDLVDDATAQKLKETFENHCVVMTSIVNSIGINELEEAIAEALMHDDALSDNQIMLTNIRHKSLVDKAIEGVKGAMMAYEDKLPLDCLTIDMKNAGENLGQITGEAVSEDVLHEIFSRFCIGK